MRTRRAEGTRLGPFNILTNAGGWWRSRDKPDVGAGRHERVALVAEYANDSPWPGQVRTLFAALAGPRRLALQRSFPGGAFHGLRTTPRSRNETIFDWFETVPSLEGAR